MDGRAFVQSNVGSVCMIVGNVCAPKPPKMTFVERNNIVEQFSTRAADPTSAVPFCQRAPDTGAQRRNITGFQEVEDVTSKFRIMVEQHISIGVGKRECLPQLFARSNRLLDGTSR